MASTTTASARLRKTFQYPDSDSEDEGLDEEHQERLIASLQAEDARTNEFYRKMFTAIPIVAGMFFLWVLVASGTARERWGALLGVSSFGMTGWGLWNMDKSKDGRGRVGGDVRGPLEKYLPVLNGVLVGVLGIAAVLSWRQGKVEEAWRSLLPGIIFGIGWVVRGLLEPVDIKELEGRRFGLKGA